MKRFLLAQFFLLTLLIRAHAAPIRILVDSIHAHNALAPPSADEQFSYHSVYGFRRAFNYLRSRGVIVDEMTSGQIDEKQLASHQMLFINLVSADLPPFRVGEIAAIRNYVQNGGGLFIITDHSNCYYHAWKLLPLLDELGIATKTETACETGQSLGPGNGWIWVSRFQSHPITRGLRHIALQTGGTVDDRFAVAQTSPQSWGDEWSSHPFGEGDEMGHYGNWKQDASERSGPLGVVLAKEFGRGRIEIVADQNIFGDPFLLYADNFRLWLNSVAWLSGNDELADAAKFGQWQGQRVLAYEQFDDAAFGNSSRDGFFNVFGDLNRTLPLYADDDLTSRADLILFAHDGYKLSPQNLEAVAAHLRAGRNVVVLEPAPALKNLPDLATQLKPKLGEATVQTEGDARAWSWPNCGQILIFPRHQWGNDLIPPPEKQPDEAQSRALEVLGQLLNATMVPAKPNG